jgi:hypothetical protein
MCEPCVLEGKTACAHIWAFHKSTVTDASLSNIERVDRLAKDLVGAGGLGFASASNGSVEPRMIGVEGPSVNGAPIGNPLPNVSMVQAEKGVGEWGYRDEGRSESPMEQCAEGINKTVKIQQWSHDVQLEHRASRFQQWKKYMGSQAITRLLDYEILVCKFQEIVECRRPGRSDEDQDELAFMLDQFISRLDEDRQKTSTWMGNDGNYDILRQDYVLGSMRMDHLNADGFY